MRLLMTWLTADSVNAVEMASPARWRSRSWGSGDVGVDVAAELADRLEQPGLLRVGLGDVEIEDQVIDGLQGAEDVAVPAEPLQPLQLRADLVGEAGMRLVRGLRVRRGGRRLLAMLAMTVIRIVRWHQSSRCSAWALR